MDWKAFKSGTDIRGFAADGFENEELFLSDSVVKSIVLDVRYIRRYLQCC